MFWKVCGNIREIYLLELPMTPPIESPRYHQEEIKEKFEWDWYDWEQVKKTLDIIAKREEVDRKLAELEWDTDAYYAYLENLVKKEQEGSWFDFSDFSLSSLKEKAEAGFAGAKEAFEKKEAEAFASAEEKVVKSLWMLAKIPIIWKFLIDWITWTIKSKYETGKEEFWQKIWMFIAWLFGIKWIGFFENLGSKEEGNLASETEAPETPIENWHQNEWDTIPESTELIPDGWKYSALGFNLLLELSLVKLKENTDKSVIRRNISQVTYWDFLEKRNTQDFRKKAIWVNTHLEDQYTKVSEALWSERVQNLIRIWLSEWMMKRLLGWFDNQKENTSIKEKLGSRRFNEISAMLENSSYSYDKLHIQELSILYVYTIPSIANNTFKNFWEWLLDWIGEVVWVWKELIVWEDVFSQEFVSKVGIESWWWNIDYSAEDFQFTNPKDISSFNALSRYKDYVLDKNNGLLNNPKLLLSSKQQELLRGKMNYRWILAIHGITWGMKIEELSPVNLPLIAWLLHEIISSWKTASDSLEATNYLRNFSTNILTAQSWSKIFTRDELTVMNIYKDKMLDMTVRIYMKEIYWALGYVWVNEENIWNIALGVWWAWVAARHAWKTWINKSLAKNKYPYLSKLAFRTWWMWILSSLALSWISIAWKVWERDAFDKDFEQAHKSWNSQAVIDILETVKDSITTFSTFEKEEIHFINYPEQVPYVVYKWITYDLRLFDKSWSIQDSWIGEVAMSILWSMAFISKDTAISGKDIKTISLDWDNLILWENVVILSIQELLSKPLEHRNISPDALSKFKKIVEENIPWYTWEFWSDGFDVLLLEKDIWGHMLWLVPRWEADS